MLVTVLTFVIGSLRKVKLLSVYYALNVSSDDEMPAIDVCIKTSVYYRHDSCLVHVTAH